MPDDASEVLRHRIAAEVRAEMGRKRVTIRQLAAALRKNHNSTWKLTRGLQPFKVEDLALTAEFLGVPVSQFMPAEPEREAVA